MFKYAKLLPLLIVILLVLTTALSISEAKNPRMISPMNGPITSVFGWRTHPIYHTQRYHSGYDIGGDFGLPIRAAAAGFIEFAGWNGGYGKLVIINHGGGVQSYYGHNQSFAVSTGDRVLQGQVIAYCGSTGDSTGPHCHFEVRENGEVVDPADYCPDIGSGSAGGSYDIDYIEMDFDGDYNYGKYIIGDGENEGIVQPIIKAATKGISLLKNYLIAIIVVLMTIDLALGGMFKTIDTSESGGKILKWVIAKFIWFGLLLYFMENWGSLFGNFMKEFFIGTGTRMAGATEETVISAFTDPTIIMQKGYHLIVPIFNELQTFHLSTTDILTSMVMGVSFIPALLELIAFVILFIVYTSMTFQILLAYIEFYIVVLFSFVSFVFAGTKYTRHIAANGLNGLFAAFISLMFFCFFSVIVQTVMENITVDAMFEVQQAGESTIVYGNGDNIRDLKDFQSRIRQIESSGDYTASNPSGAYGAYQFMPSTFEDFCTKYVNDGGTLCLSSDHNPSGAPVCTYAFCPENQDKVAEYAMNFYYKKYGNWHDVAVSWNAGEAWVGSADSALPQETQDYLVKLGNTKPGGMPPKVMNLVVILQLVLVSILLLYFGARLHKLIITQFGSMGFKFTNEV